MAPFPTTPILVPVQGSGVIGVTTDSGGQRDPDHHRAATPPAGTNDFGGRIIRILPDGMVNTFAYGFDTSDAQDYTSFIDSSLTIGFSADGTTLYASDDEGIWQFKTTADLADSTSGTLVGLNDLRTLGVPYDGQSSAVAVVDTGVDASAPSFRGRVAAGYRYLHRRPRQPGPAPRARPRRRPRVAAAAAAGGGRRRYGDRQRRLANTTRRARHAGRRHHRPVRAAGDHRIRSISSSHTSAVVDRSTAGSSSSAAAAQAADGGGTGGAAVAPRVGHVQRPDLDQSALQRPAIRDSRTRSSTTRSVPARSTASIAASFAFGTTPDVPERSRRLQAVSRRS